MGIRIMRTLFLLLCAGGVIYFPLVFGGGAVIEPGFPGALPVLILADRAISDDNSATPLTYDLPSVDDTQHLGYRMPHVYPNYFVTHFVVPPWMPANVHIRAILRVRHELSGAVETRTECSWGQPNEEDDNHSAITNSTLMLPGQEFYPVNKVTAGLSLTGLTQGDIVTCAFMEWVTGGSYSEDMWFVGFEVYE